MAKKPDVKKTAALELLQDMEPSVDTPTADQGWEKKREWLKVKQTPVQVPTGRKQ